MANHPSARRRARRNGARATVNKSRVSRIRTFIKKVEEALTAGNADLAREALKKVQPELDRGVSKGVLKRNAASRKLSRLTAKVKSI